MVNPAPVLEMQPLQLQGTPRQVFRRLRDRKRIALLESARLMPGLASWSYIAGSALAVLQTRGGVTTWSVQAKRQTQWDDPFLALAKVLQTLRMPPGERPAGLAFAGGLVGHLGYDLVRAIERLPQRALVDPPLPEMRLLLADHVLAYEHASARWYLASVRFPWADAAARARVWRETLDQARSAEPVPARGFRAGPLASRTAPERYREDVARCLEYIAAGDIFQVNLSHRLEGAFRGDPYSLYELLAAANPAPFAAYIESEDAAIASLSPERFLKLSAASVVARPIKGTRARGPDPAEDERRRAQLAASEKDRAENLMIVDLMRNDLGRVARIGSVRVDELWRVEAHPSVWQMVSSIRAELRPEVGPAELLRACWPPGSMTGAPKVRAMEIIEALEPVRRGPYAGAIGYFDAAGDMDLSVVIRTVVCAQGRLMLQLGGAVVADSTPQAELDESYAKGRFLLRALQEAPLAGRKETPETG